MSKPAAPQGHESAVAGDPEAPPPGRARWFGLDAIDLRSGPRLIQRQGRHPAQAMPASRYRRTPARRRGRF